MYKTMVLLMIGAFCTLPVSAQISQKVFCNQAGYNLNEAKFFTCPNCPDGKVFNILDNKGKIVFTGKIAKQQGNFTAFNPSASQVEYVIDVKAIGRSVPFWVADHLMEKLSSRLAYQFFIDVRGAYSSNALPSNITGGGPSRDGGGQTLEATFEGLLYASNPALFDRWNRELRLIRENIMFAVVPPNDNEPESDHNDFFQKNNAEWRQMPDLVKLLLWHADYAYNNYNYKGIAGGAYENWTSYNKVRMYGYEGQTLESFDYQNFLDQLAAVCAFYHSFLKPYMSEDTYNKYRKACLENWELYDRHKEVRYWTYSYKWIDEGYREFNEQGNAFGQGLLRNLLMYECEKNENSQSAARFLMYAQSCANDIIKNWDFYNPWHTWAMRNAEHITPQALALFILMEPDKVPPGAKEKMVAYSNYIKQRTDNLWQYRTHSDTEWAHRKSKEIGTVAGMGGNCFATAAVLNDSALRAIGWSQVNYVFGNNPAGAHLGNKSSARVALKGYWDGVETGWPFYFIWGTGELGYCRGTLDGSPTNSAFPFKPDSAAISDQPGIYGTEGWSISNRAWLSTVMFSTLGSQAVAIRDIRNNPISSVEPGSTVIIELRAALNQDWEKAEKGWVLVSEGDNPSKRIEVTETGPNTGIFTAKYSISPILKGSLKVSYGYMAFEKSCTLPVMSKPDTMVKQDAQSNVSQQKKAENDYNFNAMLQPVPLLSKFTDPKYYVWDRTMVKGDDGKYHMFYSRWPLEYGFNAWVTHSEVVHAVGDSPIGPFVFKNVALPARGNEFWDGMCTHNPTILKFGKKYYIYYMGNRGDGKVVKTAGSLNWVHRNNQRIGVAVADSPDGPWQRFDKPLIDVSADPSSPDALMVGNVSVTQRPDGGYLMVYKCVGKKSPLPFGGPVVHLVATSDSPTGPFKKQMNPIFTKEGVHFAAEDPFIWYSGDRYWAIVKDMNGIFTGKGTSTALFESSNGSDWKLSAHTLVATTELTWEDGRKEKLERFERPQLYFENGIPVVLMFSASNADDTAASTSFFTVAIPLKVR